MFIWLRVNIILNFMLQLKSFNSLCFLCYRSHSFLLSVNSNRHSCQCFLCYRSHSFLPSVPSNKCSCLGFPCYRSRSFLLSVPSNRHSCLNEQAMIIHRQSLTERMIDRFVHSHQVLDQDICRSEWTLVSCVIYPPCSCESGPLLQTGHGPIKCHVNNKNQERNATEVLVLSYLVLKLRSFCSPYLYCPRVMTDLNINLCKDSGKQYKKQGQLMLYIYC